MFLYLQSNKMISLKVKCFQLSLVCMQDKATTVAVPASILFWGGKKEMNAIFMPKLSNLG